MDGPRVTIDLPREIQYLIIDCAKDNKKTLRNCHAVCRSWSKVARKYLFKTLMLDSYTVEAASAILQHSNSIAPYFQCVKMTFVWENDKNLIRKGVELLPSLSSVTTFWTDMHYHDTSQDLEVLMKAFLRNITELIISPHRGLFNDICRFIAQAPSLDLFMLHQVDALKYNQRQPPSFDPPMIQVLGVYSENLLPFCTWFGSKYPPIIHTLRLRIVDLQPESVVNVSLAFKALGNTLKDLHLVVISTNGAIAPLSPFDLSHNVILQTITINPNRIYSKDLHAWVVATFSTIPTLGSPGIENLHLSCAQLHPCTHVDLATLAKIAPLISQPSPALRTSRLRYSLPAESNIKELEVLLQERTPELYSTGRITLSLTE